MKPDVVQFQTLQKIACKYIPEPLLVFGDEGKHVDPKSGIARYGPRSLGLTRHPSKIKVGLIGTAESMDKSKQWVENNAFGVTGDEKHPEFPGFQSDRGFFSSLEFDNAWIEQITKFELDDILKIKASRDRFEAMVDLLDEKLRLLAERDQPPTYIIVGLTNEIMEHCSTVDYFEKKFGWIHRDLRRSFKALAMKHHIPTQMLRQPTMEGKDKDHPSKIAWNFFTGTYFKAGGIPWGPTGLAPGTCYVGISFYKPLNSRSPRVQTSLVQAFDEHGEGLVLRGHDIEWDSKKEGSLSPHLNNEQAHLLISIVLDRYKKEMKQLPSRVVIHKTSRFWPNEKEGFDSALHKYVARYDLLSLEPQSTVRLITQNQYPPLRGTQFSVGQLDYIYTTGFLADLGEFHSMHVPSPLRISDHIGQDTSRDALVKEILILSKMNWNSSRLGGLLPVTIKFSQLVGDIMREIPPEREPLPQFKFYI